MKNLYLLLLFLLLSLTVSAVNVDSLHSLLSKRGLSEDLRSEALKSLAWDVHLFSDHDSTLFYADQLIEFAKQHNLPKEKASGYYIKGTANYLKSSYNDAIDFYEKALTIYQEIDDSKGIINVRNQLGLSLNNSGFQLKAINHYEQALVKAKAINDQLSIASVSNNIGVIYKNNGDIAKAITYFMIGLKAYEALENNEGIAGALSNIGLIYQSQNEIIKAIDYHNRSLGLFTELKDSINIANTYNNLGICYYQKDSLPQALTHHHKSLEIREQVNNSRGIINSLHNIGVVYLNMKDYQRALDYLNKSLLLANQNENPKSSVQALNEIAYIYYITKDYKNAKYNGEKAKSKLSENQDIKLQSRNADVLYRIYKALEMSDKALAMHERHIVLRDSIISEQNQKEVMRQKFQYEYEKQQAIKDAEHEAQMEVSAAEKKRQKTITYAVSSGLALVVLFSFFLYNRFRVTQKQKAVIEEKEKETSKQKEIVEEKNKEILDSINYAKRLQEAILPPTKLVNSYLTESFILYKPKDIVAGDFYFMDVVEENNKRLIYYVAADCTGHGVPGAMVSIVGANGLKRCIQEFNLRDPGKILDKLAELVAENFAQSEEKIRDGMDLALCCLEIENGYTTKLHYAGANNPLWIINPQRENTPKTAKPFRQEGGYEIKADKQAIGYTENIKPFTTHTLSVEKGDTFYTFSDGYPDQFGGEAGKKYKSANFKKLLLSMYDKPMDKQQEIINKEFEKWKGGLEQVDDVCIIGVRVEKK